MSGAPDVSVVMSVFNGAEHLRQTMDSILAQEDLDFELIAINDGSTDGAGEILDSFRRDPRVRVIHQENTGLTRALITGCSMARAPLIARHDAGDWSHPRRLVEQKQSFDREAEDLVLVSCWTDYVGPEGEYLYTVKGEGKADRPARIIDHQHPKGVIDGPTSHPSVMFRRDAYQRSGGYRAEFRYGQDWDLWYRLAEIGSFLMLPRVLYTARVTVDSISGTARARQMKVARLSRAALEARRQGLPEHSILAESAGIVSGGPVSRCTRAAAFYFIGEALRRNGDRRARRYLLEAALRCPTLLRAWIRWIQSIWI